MFRGGVGGGIDEGVFVNFNSPANTAGGSNEITPTRLRENFPETWIWTEVTEG